MAEYIEAFRNYSEMYVTGENLEELKRCVDYAARLNMANIYLHIPTWGARYHPTDRDTYDLNKKIFPNGHSDFRELCEYAASEGVGVTIRTLSHSISLENPVYVSSKPDQRLSHFWRGNLVEAIDADADRLVIRSDQTLPTSHGMPGFKREANPRAEYRFVLLGDEVLKYESYETHADGTITLKVAKERNKLMRGYGRTQAAAHAPGASVRILAGTFGDKVSADHDSTLLDEVAQRYADFNNTMQLNNASFDGLMLYTINTPYGETKFPGLVYSKLDHPTFADSSIGPPRWGFFETEFHQVREALGLDKPRAIPGRMQVRLGLHDDYWPAPSPYGYSYAIVPNAVARYMWCSLQEQDSLHDLKIKTLEGSGLVERYAAAIDQWRRYGPQLPDPVKQRIFNAYSGRGKYPIQVEHFRFEEKGRDLDVIPFQPMRRKEGDRGWGFIQEHGPVYTYQYTRPNTEGLVQVDNPYHGQTPEFIIRVMQDFDRNQFSAKSSKEGIEDSFDRLLGVSPRPVQKIHADKEQGAVEHDLMIPLDPEQGKAAQLKSGQMRLEVEPEGARIAYDNQSARVKSLSYDDDKESEVVSYQVSANLDKARGLGVVLTGDGSNALLVIRIRGGRARDYVIPIDFVGRRYVEIADPQVSWSEARWPITEAWKRWRGDHVNTVLVGFGSVPSKTDASVFIEDIRLLPEKPTALINPVIQYGEGSLEIQGAIPSDRYLWYQGGDRVGIYDLNWNPLETLPVVSNGAQVPSGRSDIRIHNHHPERDPWLECQFFVKDQPVYRIQR